MLTITDLHYRIEGRPLFEGASVTLPTGAKTGFVGRNGSGKTTLFNLILGTIGPEQGTVDVNRRARIGTVAQEAPASDMTVLEMVLAADTERNALLDEAETATDPHRIADIHTRLADIDAHTAEARASTVLKGLGFGPERQNIPCRELSGGWRMRVALAGVLFSQPDLLLLDEPTNYLDLEGTLWLERYLASYPYTVFMISHDRDLLNKAVDSIIHLDRGKLTYYKGAYDTFEETRRMQMDLQNKAREKTLAQIEHMQKFVDKFRYKATKAKQAQSRLKKIEKLRPPEALFDEYSAPFTFPEPRKSPASPMLAFDDVSVGYDEKPILSRISNRIDPEDRIALIGVNGNGKSTFAKLIAGELRPMGGRMERARTLEVAYFAQHQLDLLKPEQTPYEHIIDLMPTDSEARRRSRVAQMGLSTSRMDTKARNLSGGERARLLMGLVTFSGPGMLILDEPTNHLDIDSRDALIHALNDFKGAVLIISHDRHIIESTCDTLWIADQGTISVYQDDLDTYQRLLTGHQGNDRQAGQSAQSGGGDRKRERQEAAARRAELAPLRKEIKILEQKMEATRKALARVESQLADPEIYTGDPDGAIRLGIEKSRLESDIASLEDTWLEKSESYEEAKAL
ncbi:ABC-F family ATP-binding cassette domain-containing protein [Pelagibacterium montanilacus]|uniref:ABC-F family ATP-binding cassette domain-containing protein n=1 Tax=Pelagibacterium montanilacus TaxID=2185280 RepID=UPI000F8D2182|nr:ABC-F family ATP-binding cassette domain-containing protein [Pelagibacterium montanilacus]